MEVAESREQSSVGPAGTEPTRTNGERNPFLDDPLMDDGRSSSLSEIDDVSDNEPSDFEDSVKNERQLENDSEAETERIEDSPHNVRKRDIVVSAGSAGPSPSKLHQSTTLDDVDDEMADDSPSKPRRASNHNSLEDENPLDEVEILDSIGQKRKRFVAGEDTGTDVGDDEPSKKRREDAAMLNEDGQLVDDAPEESELPAVPAKSKKAKKGKRRGRRAPDVEEENEAGGAEVATEDVADEHLGEDEETAERGDEPQDAEITAKTEEESAKRMSAMESLATLEKEFATLRDKIYDERIAKLDREMEMLTGPNPTHPEYLRQIECVARNRDKKIRYEETLFHYRKQALLNKSLAERAQAHSTFFQRIRDARERHSSAISKQFYAIQHDRFKTDELSPHHIIPFPTRRSQQISHQTSYNLEVSIMAGVAKYVGFPAAPPLVGARPSELDDDLEKMGIAVETRKSVPQASSALPPRGAMSSMSSNMFRTDAEEAFLEQTPWANPQHPIHQQQPQHQYSQQHRPQARAHESQQAPFTTPAAQKRVVDVNAPNGSASTIPENMSAANSSANNTPYGTEQEPRSHHQGPFRNPEFDVEHKPAFRSQSSSPLDVRKPIPNPSRNVERRSPNHDAPPRTSMFSPPPPPVRQGLFQSSAALKADPSSAHPSKPVDAVHYRPTPSELPTGVGSGHLPAR
ncbi:hypothetical protein N7470_009160 [Penicillium chermesinum]|nr:hypothetical protein N7470_009160 [Penicillium chermesinum]